MAIRYSVGVFIPGYLPDNEPAEFDSAEDAVAAHLDGIREHIRAIEDDGDYNENGWRFADYLTDVDLVEDLRTDWDVYFDVVERADRIVPITYRFFVDAFETDD